MEHAPEPGIEFDPSANPAEEESQAEKIENRASFMARLEGLPEDIIRLVDFAYDLSKEGHRPQKREAGERYFEHPRSVALILLDECGIKDPDLIITALLHDSVEDTAIFGNSTLAYSEWKKTALFRISKVFNPEVARAVIALTKPKVDGRELKTKEDAFALYIEGLAAAPAKTILVKMADRLHNLRTLKDTPPEKQRRKVAETKEIYFPLFRKVLQDYPAEGQRLLDEMEKTIAALNLQ